ncbi:MAG: glycosyltransferase [Janthinobacterium lividum]
MFPSILIVSSAVCALVPAVLFCVNLRRYCAPDAVTEGGPVAVSVLIPARNEEANIAAVIRSVLASRGVALEVLVLDDDSADNTAEIVRGLAAVDTRVRLVAGRGLPPGWNGKQHACWVLAQEASHGLLVFLDADVRVEPELFSRMAGFRETTHTGLVSGFPRLVTITWLEKLLLPLIHFVLLGFLPMGSMRRSTVPSVAAGCGQFMLAERTAYFASGGHAAIRETMHDGLMLPRVMRKAGYRTDIADITELASVRMYDSAAKVWQGLAKNATEGIATVGKIVPLSGILLLGQVVPAVLSLLLISGTLFTVLLHGGFGLTVAIKEPRVSALLVMILFTCLLASYLPRLLAVRRFRQPLSSALLHPVGILLLLSVQWYALARKLFGKPVGWRQRTYSSETGTQVG